MQQIVNNCLKTIVKYPKTVLMILALIGGFFSTWLDDFQLDASSDSLLLEDDLDLRYYRNIKARYGDDEFLVVTYQPKGDLFSQENIDNLEHLRDELNALDSIKSIVSILDVPLLKSPPQNLSDLEEYVPNLLSASTDRDLAKKELLTSKLFQNLVISSDGNTTAMQLKMVIDENLESLIDARDILREKRLVDPLNANEENKLTLLSSQIREQRAVYRQKNVENIAEIRAVLDRYRSNNKIFLGGTPMITVDMIDYIASDIEIFGISLLVFLIIALLYIFKRPRWMLISMACCFLGLIVMTGFSGFIVWLKLLSYCLPTQSPPHRQTDGCPYGERRKCEQGTQAFGRRPGQ